MSRSVREVLRLLPGATVGGLRVHDLLLYGAGVTFYAAVAVVPGLLIATRLLVAVVGREPVLDLAGSLASALPTELGADRVAGELLGRGADVGWLGVLVAVLPASVYGEGLRRAYLALADDDADDVASNDRLVGWRGRFAVLPLLAVAPALLLAVLAVTPWLAGRFGSGAGPTALGVYVALNVDWLVLSAPLAWTFRVVAPTRLPWSVCAVGALATAAFVSGFLQGFVLFLALPVDLGAPFGGVGAVGGAVAVLLWLWVLHLVVLVGWVATREAHRLRHPEPSPP